MQYHYTTHSLDKYKTEYLKEIKFISLSGLPLSDNKAIMKELGHPTMVIFSELWYT